MATIRKKPRDRDEALDGELPFGLTREQRDVAYRLMEGGWEPEKRVDYQNMRPAVDLIRGKERIRVYSTGNMEFQPDVRGAT